MKNKWLLSFILIVGLWLNMLGGLLISGMGATLMKILGMGLLIFTDLIAVLTVYRP